MTTTVEAIYENGVLRLLEPIALPEGTRVQVVVAERSQQVMTPPQILAEIAAMPEEGGGEPFSGRDHDTVLYGKKANP